MTATAIEDVLGKRPFQTFLIQFDGTSVLVDHPERAIASNMWVTKAPLGKDGEAAPLTADRRQPTAAAARFLGR